MRSNFALFMATILPVAILSGCAATIPESKTIIATQSPEQRADQVGLDALKTGPFAGISIAVSKDGQVIYQRGFGLVNVETGQKVTVNTRFPIGSITKPLTCLSVQQLVEQGKIDTDAPIGRYLPTLRAPSRDVPVRNLLDHSSGIENYLELPNFPYDKPMGLDRGEMTRFFDAMPLRTVPGENFSYSNSNTYLLGLLIEAVTGESYDQYVTGHVFAPFAMKHSDFAADPSGESDRALGYNSRAGAFTPARGYDWLVPFSAGAAVSTSGDLVRFADGLFGKTLPDSVRSRLLVRNTLGDGKPSHYTQGCLVAGQLGDARKFAHSGSIYGFSSHMAHYPDQHLSVVVLTNSQGENYPPVTLSNRIARIFLGQPAPVLTEVPVDPASFAWIEGNYNVGHRRLGIDRLGFAFQDGQLQLFYDGLDSGAPPLALVSLGDGRFVSPLDDEQYFQFVQTSKGADVVLTYYDGLMPFHKQP